MNSSYHDNRGARRTRENTSIAGELHQMRWIAMWLLHTGDDYGIVRPAQKHAQSGY